MGAAGRAARSCDRGCSVPLEVAGLGDHRAQRGGAVAGCRTERADCRRARGRDHHHRPVHDGAGGRGHVADADARNRGEEGRPRELGGRGQVGRCEGPQRGRADRRSSQAADRGRGTDRDRDRGIQLDGGQGHRREPEPAARNARGVRRPSGAASVEGAAARGERDGSKRGRTLASRRGERDAEGEPRSRTSSRTTANRYRAALW